MPHIGHMLLGTLLIAELQFTVDALAFLDD